MKWVKRGLLALGGIAILLAGLFGHFVYAPTASKPDLLGEFSQHNLTIHEQTRRFAVYRPTELPTQAPVIFFLHGSGSSGDGVRRAAAYEFDLLADQRKFLLVYPEGFEHHWNDCRASADYSANTRNIDDPAFFNAMIRYLRDHYAISTRHVFVAGWSNGGHMAYRLALEEPQHFAGVAAIGANLPVVENLDCEPSNTAISVAMFNGTTDPINPYYGGTVKVVGNASRGEVRASRTTMDYWLALAGIDSGVDNAPRVIEHPDVDGNRNQQVIEHRWGADAKYRFRLYELRGSGHVIPSKIARFPRLAGGDAGDISAAQEIVGFFLDPLVPAAPE